MYAIKQRTLINVYETNRFLKSVGYFAILKQLSTTGKIHNNIIQRKNLEKLFKVSRNQVQNIVNYLQELQMIKCNASGSIILKGWNEICTIFNVNQDDNKIIIDYCINDKKRIDLLIYAAEIKLNQDKQKNALACKLSNNPGIYQIIKDHLKNDYQINADDLNFNELQQVILKLQKDAFVIGTQHSKSINMFRCSIDRKLTTLKQTYNTKSVRTITYLKRLLQKFGIAKIIKMVHHSCNGERAYKFCKHYANNFNKETRQPIWYQPDQILLC
jgi:recombinational DNA repair protein RecR